MSDQFDHVFMMTVDLLARFDRGERVALLIIERDRLLRQLSPDDQRLFQAWAAQEQPS